MEVYVWDAERTHKPEVYGMQKGPINQRFMGCRKDP